MLVFLPECLCFIIWGELFYWTFNFYFAFLTMLVSKLLSSLSFTLGSLLLWHFHLEYVVFYFIFFLLGRSEIGISILNLNLNDNSATNNRTKSVFRWIYQCMIHISYDWEIDFRKWISDPASLNINATEMPGGPESKREKDRKKRKKERERETHTQGPKLWWSKGVLINMAWAYIL